jgi:hypothetical protein
VADYQHCPYELDRVWVHKTIERFEQLHRDHAAALSVLEDKLEKKFKLDMDSAHRKIRALEGRPWRVVLAAITAGAGLATILHYVAAPLIRK